MRGSIATSDDTIQRVFPTNWLDNVVAEEEKFESKCERGMEDADDNDEQSCGLRLSLKTMKLVEVDFRSVICHARW